MIKHLMSPCLTLATKEQLKYIVSFDADQRMVDGVEYFFVDPDTIECDYKCGKLCGLSLKECDFIRANDIPGSHIRAMKNLNPSRYLDSDRT